MSPQFTLRCIGRLINQKRRGLRQGCGWRVRCISLTLACTLSLSRSHTNSLPLSQTYPLSLTLSKGPLVKHNPHLMWCDVWVWASTFQPHNHTITHNHTLPITCTCCYDEVKGTQDQDFSCSFSDSHSLTHSLTYEAYLTQGM